MTEQLIEASKTRLQESFKALKEREEWCHDSCRELALQTANDIKETADELFIALLAGTVSDEYFVAKNDKLAELLSTLREGIDVGLTATQWMGKA